MPHNISSRDAGRSNCRSERRNVKESSSDRRERRKLRCIILRRFCKAATIFCYFLIIFLHSYDHHGLEQQLTRKPPLIASLALSCLELVTSWQCSHQWNNMLQMANTHRFEFVTMETMTIRRSLVEISALTGGIMAYGYHAITEVVWRRTLLSLARLTNMITNGR